jgi:hypothetical protein
MPYNEGEEVKDDRPLPPPPIPQQKQQQINEEIRINRFQPETTILDTNTFQYSTKNKDYIQVIPLNAGDTLNRIDTNSKNNLITNSNPNLLNTNIYSSGSVTSVKYVVDLQDLLNNQRNLDTLKTMVSSNRHPATIYESSQSQNQLISSIIKQDNDTQQQEHKNKTIITENTKTNNNVNVNMGCCGPMIGLINFTCHIMNLMSSCCCRPCISAAAILGGLGTLATVLAAAILMGFMGLIPLPNDLTEKFCENNLVNYSMPPPFPWNYTNYTNYNNWPQNYNLTNDLTLDSKNLSNSTDSSQSPSYSVEVKTDSSLIKKKKMNRFYYSLKNKIKSKIRNLNKLKNRVIKYTALSYNVYLMPKSFSNLFLTDATTTTPNKDNNLRMEMKINMEVGLVCKHPTNVLFFSTRPFSNINLK